MPRENQQREGQPYQPRDQHQPREHNQNRDHRPQPQYQSQPQSQPDVGVDRLPSFITGPQPQINGGPINSGGFEGNGGERFPSRRRRRPHGPRPEGMAPATPGDDFNPGNE